ncbi:MAG: heavy-metal-associated domain-containing protein [Planctomycetes bacterium]|nr:heavy-metal-associated domain-containing protein [Planctomycetota bacterium]
MSKILASCLIAFGLLVAVGTHAQSGGNPPAYTVITVEKMHCEGCAKRIAGKLYEVPGVDKIQVDVKQKILWVHPKAGVQPSPRGLWEAVEKGSDTPVRLQGPYGTFTAKPKS